MSSMTVLSPAKVNLFLHITSQREDGYHHLQTVFRLLNWGDEMRFVVSEDMIDIPPSLMKTPSASSEDSIRLANVPIRLHCDTVLTDDIQDNLITKSAYALLTYVVSQQTAHTYHKSIPIIDIYLDKKIPMGAGLGGGSSNSATTLMMLNQLWQFGLSSTELQKIGVTLGADVPIFIYAKDSGSAIAEGIGEIFTPIELPKQSLLLLTPSAHISTAKLFASPQLQRNKTKLSTNEIIHNPSAYTDKLAEPYENVFEPVVCGLSEPVTTALQYLQQLEPIIKSTARMTGSGSCVFLPLPSESNISKSMLYDWIEHAPCNAYLVQSY